MGKQLSIILSTSERITFLSIDAHTVFLPSAKEMVCTFSLSSHMNCTSPSCLLNWDAIRVLIARCENWSDVFFMLSNGSCPGLLSYATIPPLLSITPANLTYWLMARISLTIPCASFLFNTHVLIFYYLIIVSLYCNLTLITNLVWSHLTRIIVKSLVSYSLQLLVLAASQKNCLARNLVPYQSMLWPHHTCQGVITQGLCLL